MANRHAEAENLLELELDRRADFGELCGEVFGVGYGGWEFTGCLLGGWVNRRGLGWVTFEVKGKGRAYLWIILVRANAGFA